MIWGLKLIRGLNLIQDYDPGLRQSNLLLSNSDVIARTRGGGGQKVPTLSGRPLWMAPTAFVQMLHYSTFELGGHVNFDKVSTFCPRNSLCEYTSL